jgi:hypothetical protein
MFWSRVLLHLKRSRLRRRFQQQRSVLDQVFLQQLSQRAESKQIIWQDLQWLSYPVIFIRDDQQEPHHVLVGVAAFFTMTAEPAQPQSQAGSAVFFFQDGQWTTSGQILLNLTPGEAWEKMANQFATLR